MKQGVRIAAFTGGPIKRSSNSTARVILVGLISRNKMIEGLLSAKIESDGSDATDKIIKVVSGSRFSDQIKIIALNGVAVAGLNVIDINKLKQKLGVEILIITRHRQRPNELIKAISIHKSQKSEKDKKIKLVRNQARLKLRNLDGFYARSSKNDMPASLFVEAEEALRISHIISRGISTGESKGRI